VRVLVTGAAGFIGSTVAASLADDGHDVIGVDAYIPQAHGSAAREADTVRGRTQPIQLRHVDVRDRSAIEQQLEGVDAVCHQAAMVGAGVNASDLPLFAGHNDYGTAVLLAAMAEADVRTLVLASSMVVYGDGRYRCPDHGPQRPKPRRVADLEAGHFEMTCPQCSRDLDWELVDEDARLDPRSGYAASKVAQEHYTSAWTRQVRGRAVALRYHNVYGPGMPQDTPYSGVAALFRSALERGEPPPVFEDGGQVRDFVHVRDVASANVLALEHVTTREPDTYAAYNVCSGQPITIREVAAAITTVAGGPDPVPTGQWRSGDVRHIVASPARASLDLGFEAVVSPDEGLAEFTTAPLRPRH
jgi:dTDP-L-rhamnose 4-epimerase